MTIIEDVRKREDDLRLAMMRGDSPALSVLIHDALVFTAPDGTVLTKAQDLSAHRDGTLKIQSIALEDMQLHPVGDMVLVTTKARLRGSFGGAVIDGAYAYTRLWSREIGAWQVIAGHASRLA